MKTFLTLQILLITLYSCNIQSNNKQRNTSNNKIKSTQNTNKIFEQTIDSINNIHVSIEQLIDSNFKSILILKAIKNEKIYSDSIRIKLSDEPSIKIEDFNEDEIPDLLIEYERPGRGGNNISKLWITNPAPLSFKLIRNSVYFPNLMFDKKLNLVSSFRFYGSDAVQMDFMELKKDSLIRKFRLIREMQNIKIEQKINNEWIKKLEDTINSDIIIPEIFQLEPEIRIEK